MIYDKENYRIPFANGIGSLHGKNDNMANRLTLLIISCYSVRIG